MDNALDTTSIVIRSAELVGEKYLFPEVGELLAALLKRRLAEGAYDGARAAEELGTLVTSDLQSVNGDRHLRLKYHLDLVPELADEAAEKAAYAVMAREDMNGIRRVERLPGNVGLVCFARLLYPAELVGASIAAAMALVADAAALIIDVRENTGGDPGTVALICSYLLGGEPVHLNSMVPRDAERATQQWWSLPWVPGPRFGTRKPIWVLTSATTFSGGEELAYDLQQLGRGTVVGERTGGGAHARVGFGVHPHLELTVPIVAARNPESGGNWEATGVVPDLPVPAAEALTTAHRLALAALAQDDAVSPALSREIVAAL